MSGAVTACATCRRRSALVAALSPRIERYGRDRERLAALLALPDDELLGSLGLGTGAATLPGLGPSPASDEDDAIAVCRHDPAFPAALVDVPWAPAALHLGGDPKRVLAFLAGPCAALIGTRRPTEYGLEVARELASSLASAGVCVVSGLAMGIDATVHGAALDAGGPTVAVLAGGVDVPYPATRRGTHRRLLAHGGVVAELPRGSAPRRWGFVARNRIVAGLAAVTVVVEARERSGTLITAGYARDLGREVAAVPGPVTSSRSDGTNGLIRDGAHLVCDARDVLDLLYGVGGGALRSRAATSLPPELDRLLALVRAGSDAPGRLVERGVPLDEALIGLTELELRGCVRRTLSGRYLAVGG